MLTVDDDNDGFSDSQELADGTDPLSRFSCRSGCGPSEGIFDIDADGIVSPFTDGILLMRWLFGFSGDALIEGVVSPSANRADR